VESLARLFVAATELLEAEGRVLKRQVARLLVAAGLGFVIVALVVTGLGFLLFGFYRMLAEPLTPAGAAMVLGAGSLLLALAAILYARRLLR
jgi:hypothetical protein